MRGQCAHHLSFDVVDDHDEIVASVKKRGIEVEMTGEIGDAAIFTYLATKNELGTTFELAKVHPGVEDKTVPYGSYPPDM